MKSEPLKNKETIWFVENIEFSENIQLKSEIKEKEGFDEEFWKSLPLDVKPKLEQKEGFETGQVKIKTEPQGMTYCEIFTIRDTDCLFVQKIDNRLKH